jgi:hypothetical protein
MNRNYVKRCFLSALLCVLLFGGCGRSGYSTASVLGRVTLDGKPLTDATVTFQPVGEGNPNPGPGSFGVTDADGRFQLQLINRKDGAVVGLHTVRISRYLLGPGTDSDTTGPRRDPSVPPQADDGSLRYQVPSGGTNAADFELTSKPSQRPK